MKSSKKLYKKKMQPPKYNPGAILAPLAAAAATSGVPATAAAATGAAATGAAATGAAATSAAATGATTAGALSASTSGTIAGATGTSSGASASTGVPFGMLKSNANPNTMQGFNSMLGIDPTKAAGGTPKIASGTPNLGSSKDAGWSGTNIEDLATGNNVNATNTTNIGNVKGGQLNQSKNASNKVKDIMQLDSINDIMNLSKLPMLAIFGIRENALERQKGRMNQMNFANNMNSNMDSGAYGDSGMMKKGGIMKSVAELTGQEYIVPKELIPYALAAGNAKPYASDKTDGAYSHETNPIQVYRAGGDMYVDEQGNTMQAGDLIIPEHKANSRAGIMSAINQNPYNNKALLGKIINPDAYKDQKGLDKYDAMAGMAAYTAYNNIMNRFTSPEQISSPALVNPKTTQYNPYFLSEQAQRMANSVYNTSQYTRSGSLSDNMASANLAMQSANDIISKQAAITSETQQQYDVKNAEMYNAALLNNADQINKIKTANAQLAFEHSKNISTINQSNNQMLSQSMQGIQQLSNDKETSDMNKLAMQYALEIQRIDSENANNIANYNSAIAQYNKDLSQVPEDQRDAWMKKHLKPELKPQTQPLPFDEFFKNSPLYKKIFPSVKQQTK